MCLRRVRVVLVIFFSIGGKPKHRKPKPVYPVGVSSGRGRYRWFLVVDVRSEKKKKNWNEE